MPLLIGTPCQHKGPGQELAWLHNYTIFPKIDLVKGHGKVLLNPADIPEIAIITLFGFV
jgi:hypothetical protein